MDSYKKFVLERRKEEYQMQHFEFCSSQFTHEGKEEVMSVIEEAATALGRSLCDKYPAVDKDKIHLATRNLIEAYSAAVEEWGPSFQERMDSNFLCIPSHVLLEEDKPQEVQYSREEVEKVDNEICALERKVIASKYLRAKLSETLKVAKKALRYQSKHKVSTEKKTPSLCPLVKAFDGVDRKRRKIHNYMDGCLLEEVSNQEMCEHESSRKNIPCSNKVKVNYAFCKISPKI